MNSFTDKENNLKLNNPKRALDSENFVIQNKKSDIKRDVRIRVPLGGKDQNLTFNRSQAGLNGSSLLKRKGLAPKVPSFGRANSSLGFTERPTSSPNVLLEKFSTEEKHSEKATLKDVKNIGSENAARSVTVVDSFTDNLQKKETKQLPPLLQTLQGTITPSTSSLNSLNLINHDIHYNNVDPVKRLTKKINFDYNFYKNKIPEFDGEVETIPEMPTPIPYTPVDMTTLNTDDMGFFSGKVNSRNIEQPPKVQETEDFELEFENEREVLGLTIDELNDLLD